MVCHQPVVHAEQGQYKQLFLHTTISTCSQRHKQPVIQEAQAQADSYTCSASTGSQLHRQAQAAQTQANTYTVAQVTSYTCLLQTFEKHVKQLLDAL